MSSWIENLLDYRLFLSYESEWESGLQVQWWHLTWLCLATAQVRRLVGNKSDSLSDKQLQIISEKHGGYDTSYQTVVTVLHITLYMHCIINIKGWSNSWYKLSGYLSVSALVLLTRQGDIIKCWDNRRRRRDIKVG